ncbi:MAG: S1 RNA-binding domain-containing protein [Firmicutes bacterium]|nr:S1 RNA-binding domain-containing protein [Bacillota bacterium]
MLAVGDIVEGKVTGLTKFGAFVSLPEGKSGLVHISEIASSYVAEVSDHLQSGQVVRVKVIGIGPDGKINLSVKRAEEPPQAALRPAPPPRSGYNRQGGRQSGAPAVPASFEDKLKQFMQESDQKNSGNKLYTENKRNPNRRRK